MSKEVMSAEEWLEKASYEGGVFEAINGYGMDHDDLDPNDDPELYEDIKKIVETLNDLNPAINRVRDKMMD